MTLQFLKSNISVINLHENLRSKFLDTLNLTDDEHKKYVNGRLTPFSFNLSLDQPNLDEYKNILMEKVPEIASSLNLQEEVVEKKKEERQKKKKANEEGFLRDALTSRLSSYDNPVLTRTFQKLFYSFHDVICLTKHLKTFDRHMLNIFSHFGKVKNIELIEDVLIHHNHGADGAVSQFLKLIMIDFQNKSWRPRDEDQMLKDYKTLVFSLVHDDARNAYKKRYALWKHFLSHRDTYDYSGPWTDGVVDYLLQHMTDMVTSSHSYEAAKSLFDQFEKEIEDLKK